jgi:hypothetical protein
VYISFFHFMALGDDFFEWQPEHGVHFIGDCWSGVRWKKWTPKAYNNIPRWRCENERNPAGEVHEGVSGGEAVKLVTDGGGFMDYEEIKSSLTHEH